MANTPMPVGLAVTPHEVLEIVHCQALICTHHHNPVQSLHSVLESLGRSAVDVALQAFLIPAPHISLQALQVCVQTCGLAHQ